MFVFYRLSQVVVVLIIVSRAFSGGAPHNLVAAVASCLGVAALLLLCSVVRLLSGPIAGVVSLLVIGLDTKLNYSSLDESASFFYLACLISLLIRQGGIDRKPNWAIPLALAGLVTFGAVTNTFVLGLSPVLALSLALLRYVPGESVNQYGDLRNQIWTGLPAASRDLALVALGPWLLLAPRLLHAIQPMDLPFAFLHRTGYLPSVMRLFIQALGFPARYDAAHAFEMLVPIAAVTTLWWLFTSIQSGNGIPFALTAIPIGYLIAGASSLEPSACYAIPAHPIVLANLINLLGLWFRGRMNKRVLDSTRN